VLALAVQLAEVLHLGPLVLDHQKTIG